MAGRDIISMTQKELKRLHVIRKVLDKSITQKEAAGLIGLCKRQIIRMVKKIRSEGDKGIIHRSRGKPSHNAKPEELKDKVRQIYRDKYWDFGPTLASEKLFEIDKIKLSDETLRLWLLESGDWKKHKKSRKHRKWRERKKYFGEMIQADGSRHDWFEGRGPECVLMGYIDDATGEVFAGFYEYEGTIPAMDSFNRYIGKYGIPQSLYMDNHSTYKSQAKSTLEDELSGRNPLSQFERAVKELGIDFIHARSPQAKGRIERLFGTFQDRVIKEMRLAGVKSIKEGNKFLKKYLPKYNERFSIPAAKKENLHRSLPEDIDINSVLCIKTERTLRNDFTVPYKTRLYQVLGRTRAKKVTVQQRISGRIVISYNGKDLEHKEIQNRPSKKKSDKRKSVTKKTSYIPPEYHPWRNKKLVSYPQSYTYPQKEKRSKKEKELLLVH